MPTEGTKLDRHNKKNLSKNKALSYFMAVRSIQKLSKLKEIYSRPRRDFERWKDILEGTGLTLEIRDLGLYPGYIKETQKYGGPEVLPLIIINGLNIGGIDELIHIVDLKVRMNGHD